MIARRNQILLALSVGLCFLGIVDAKEGLVFRTNVIDEIAYFAFLWSPVVLALGAILMISTNRSARLSLWVLAAWWTLFRIGDLYYELPAFQIVAVILFLVALNCYLFFETLKFSQHNGNRVGIIVLPICAALVVCVPIILNVIFHNSQIAFLQSTFGSPKIFLLHVILFLCVFIYDWMRSGPLTAN